MEPIMIDKSIRKRVEAIKRKKIASKKVVKLSEFRDLTPSLDHKTILVVDDDEIMRSGLKRVLQGEGYNVLLAQDGLELSKVLESTKLDMVLLDINLPWVDGFELCGIIKAHKSLKEVPLVLVSARNDQDDLEHGFKMGANDYVVKPFEVDHIINVINKSFKDSE